MDNVNTILQKVINDTEFIFAGIAENYPRLLSELDEGLVEASGVIKSFSMVNTEEAGNRTLDEFLESCRSESSADLESLNQFQEKNRLVFRKLTAAIEGYRSSQKNIEEIRDISESLQIVSLNALCNAIKAGKGGEGFSVITGDLKNVTETTIEKTGILEKKGAEVRRALDEFNVIEEEISTQRKDMLVSVEKKVMSGIKAFQTESETINQLFRELSGESSKIRSSILEIMEELQQQDLIRQTIDQIILSTEEMPEGCDSCESMPDLSGEAVDKIVFTARIISLSNAMILDVEGKVNKAAEKFTANFGLARKKLEYIQNEKEKAVSRFMENNESMKELEKISDEIRMKTGELSQKRSSLMTLIQSIIVNAGLISEEFASFEKISGWLQNMAVLSRIELSRSSSLGGMRESVEDMSGLVERIQIQISEGEKETLAFINILDGIFNEYRTYANEEVDFLYEFTDLFSRNIKQISGINMKISNILSEFDFFTDDFHRLFIQSEKELDQLREIAQNLKRVRTELECVETKMQPVLEEKLQGASIASWKITDDDMNSVIERFTIYSHKKTAGDVIGFEVEDSVLDEGEITLF